LKDSQEMKMNKNLHLVPINVVDIVERLNNKDLRDNEKQILLQRLETIRDYCASAIVKNNGNSINIRRIK